MHKRSRIASVIGRGVLIRTMYSIGISLSIVRVGICVDIIDKKQWVAVYRVCL